MALEGSAPLSRAWHARPLGLLVTGVLGVLLVATFDYLTGPEIAFSIFYVLPVSRVAWLGGTRAGLIGAVLASLAWLGMDIQDHVYSHPAVHVWNALVRGGFFALTAFLIARVRQLNDALRAQAESDGLTRLPNSRHFFAGLERELKRAQRAGAPISLAYVDLDNFKTVNDTKGHLVGDEVLRAVAEVMRRSLRGSDLPARMGGDEFAVLLPDTGLQGAQTAAHTLHAAILHAMAGIANEVGASIGVVTFEELPPSAEDIVREADALMYEVKHSGKNAVRARIAKV